MERPMATAAAEEVLVVAIHLEESLEVCYEILANLVGPHDDAASHFFAHFANEEDEHYRVFSQMLHELRQRDASRGHPLSDEAVERIRKLIADVVTPSADAIEQMLASPRVTLEQALDLALATERDTIGFYQGMLAVFTEPGDVEVVQRILVEEQKHEQDLLARRASMLAP